MNTVMLWLLVSVGYNGHSQTAILERFASAEECQRVLRLVDGILGAAPPMRCIQATVVKP